MSETTYPGRRQFLGAAATTFAAASLGLIPSAHAGAHPTKPAAASPSKRRSNPSLGPVKQINAGLLDVGYVEVGPTDGRAIVLLHGWPYDIHSYDDVAPALGAKGYRVIVPYLRGFGTTRFLSDATLRNGQQAALGQDIIALMDALRIEKATIAGFDWGARTADVMATLWPERVRSIVAVSGHIIVNRETNLQPLPPAAEHGWWYQYYFATERGRLGYAANRYDFNKLIWQLASPRWAFDEATYARSAASFENPDHVSIVIHNYRWRLSLADGERQYDALEDKLAAGPLIQVPAITISSDFDGAAADGAAYAKKFIGRYDHRILRGIGHNVPQEAPEAFTHAVIDADRYAG
jgi:pimeloyl-ACP methyl ester carboxylesterase